MLTMDSRPHVQTLPEWWLKSLGRMTGIKDFDASAMRPYVPVLRQLSAHLNDVEERRGKAMTYMRDRRQREAYLLYYATVNFPKLLWPLGELWPDGPPEGDGPLRILDVGCGPGTGVAGLHAWADRQPNPRPMHVRGIDAVEANAALYRETGRLLREMTGHPIECDAAAGDVRHLDGEAGSVDLIMGMNVLNELPDHALPRFLDRSADLLAPRGALLLVEPALRTTSRILLQLRDSAVENGWTVVSPCFRQGNCPALVNEKDWCHHDIPWERPAYIEWLDEEIGNIKKSLKFSCMVLRREPATAAGADHAPLRVVSELFVEKGRTWCFCCGEEGRRIYQRNHRDRTDENGLFDGLMRYDAITLEGEDVRANDVRISAATAVRAFEGSTGGAR